jgi:hypothetical protein
MKKRKRLVSIVAGAMAAILLLSLILANATIIDYSTVNSVHSILLYCMTSTDFFMPSFS